jgi:AmmeMemoRadiSam system protein A
MELHILPKLARMAILEKLENKKLINAPEWLARYPWLKEKRASFVTLRKHGALRGCIGSIIPYRPLFEDIIENARAAAFADPRFPPLTKEEYPEIEVEISLLTIPQLLEYSDIEDLRKKIVPHKHGVILQLNNHQATFLPSVWEELPDFDTFFAHLCLKAGLTPNCLEFHPTIYTYEAIEVKEEK